MMTTPRRRWFTFSLRTQFAVLTALCIVGGCVAYQLNWIRQRHAVLIRGEAWADGFNTRPPLLPGLLGEDASRNIVVSRACSHGDIERIRRLFPEAHVERFLGDTPVPGLRPPAADSPIVQADLP